MNSIRGALWSASGYWPLGMKGVEDLRVVGVSANASGVQSTVQCSPSSLD